MHTELEEKCLAPFLVCSKGLLKAGMGYAATQCTLKTPMLEMGVDLGDAPHIWAGAAEMNAGSLQ